MSLAYLDRLNLEQRQAVEHGVGALNGQSKRPLLVIAGAGSGKTSTLAHRVAHLIVNGADPRRILLMTFSRRAAAEMTRRAERIIHSATGGGAVNIGARLPWAGTFHGIGVQLLRAYANEIGLDPAFTIHDRGDSADLLNLVRHQLGFSKTSTRFPVKGTCLAIYSRCINAELTIEEVIGRVLRFEGHAGLRGELFDPIQGTGRPCPSYSWGISPEVTHMRGKWLGTLSMISAILLGPAPAVAQHEQGQRGGGQAAPRSGARGHAKHRGPVAGSRPGGRHFEPPRGGVDRGGHYAGSHGEWRTQPAWRGNGAFERWHAGHWWHGRYEGRLGWWWVVGPDWYWYPSQVAPVPDPYTPPGMAPGYWYWCDSYQQYYPYVGACPVPWRPVVPQ